ncbi:MAG: PAS domain S-box protein [Candidatus Lokiarchaeota archaeon]|nr:PAS domain S-box protein [Candidatus Lokiarchaeota archaeon]MBD3198858.1 PAS domain S-box protein [Candidatus Lokiarchaeota archaeon]
MDIEEFLRSLNKLKEFKYRVISENANDLIIVFNKNYEIEHANENVIRRYFDFSLDELKTFRTKIIHPDDRENAINFLKKIFSKGESKLDLRVKIKNKHYLWVEAKGKRYIEDGDKKALIIARDITERRDAEEKLRKTNNVLKLLKDLFTHDINTILQNIYLSINLLQNNLIDIDNFSLNNNDKIKMLINTIKAQTTRGNKLLSDVRKLSSFENIQFSSKRTEIIELIKNAKDFVINSFPDRKIKIDIQGDKDKINSKGNELLVDVFENILINGIHHNDNDLVEITIKVSEQNNYIKLEFLDNGIGIPDKMKEQIFSPDIEHQKESMLGLGIGLSLVKKIIEKLEGTITVEDRINGDHTRGSNFIIEIAKFSNN